MRRSNLVMALLVAVGLLMSVSIVIAQPPRPRDGQPTFELDDSIFQATLDVSNFETYGDALIDQIALGDGGGNDDLFRNSGVVIDEENNLYYGVNGVHPVNRGDYTSYYPKSIVAASLETDEIVAVYSFDEINGHEVDMEALTFADGTDFLYIGDEYNYIYELDLSTGEITREWDLADINIETEVDRGIESLSYAQETGYFYAGIQEPNEVYILDLNLESETTEISIVSSFDSLTSPSGLFVHPNGNVYMTIFGASQYIFRFNLEGELNCAIGIPEELNMTQPDGIWISSDDQYLYLVDSQGPAFDGYSLYQIAWTDPCDL